MKLLKEICHNQEKPCEKYRLRKAARSLVFNSKNEIALMNVSKHNYYKLPGGGIKLDEDIYKALEREIKEEVGAKIEIVRELGCIIEYGNELELLQINYCFVSNLKALGEPEFTETEIFLPLSIALTPACIVCTPLSTINCTSCPTIMALRAG